MGFAASSEPHQVPIVTITQLAPAAGEADYRSSSRAQAGGVRIEVNERTRQGVALLALLVWITVVLVGVFAWAVVNTTSSSALWSLSGLAIFLGPVIFVCAWASAAACFRVVVIECVGARTLTRITKYALWPMALPRLELDVASILAVRAMPETSGLANVVVQMAEGPVVLVEHLSVDDAPKIAKALSSLLVPRAAES